MKIKVKDYEIEIKAKDTSTNEKFNRFDTEYALSELELVLVYARQVFDDLAKEIEEEAENNTKDNWYRFLSKRANEWFSAIDEVNMK